MTAHCGFFFFRGEFARNQPITSAEASLVTRRAVAKAKESPLAI